jgi:hypothetical protein
MTGFSLLTLGLAVVIGFSTQGLTRADDAPATASAPAAAKATGTISGKVVDSTGKAVSGATVNAYNAADMPAGGRGRGGNAGGQRPTAVSTATTADDGTYKLDAVPVGKILVTARLQGTGNGRSKELTVTEGKDTAAGDIKLAQRQRGAGGGRNAAPAGNN